MEQPEESEQPSEPIDIIIQHIGSAPSMASSSDGESITGDAPHARVIVKYADKTTKVIFIGQKFSEEEYNRRLEERKPPQRKEPQ